MKIANKLKIALAGLTVMVSGLGLVAPAMATSGLTSMGAEVTKYISDSDTTTGKKATSSTLSDTVQTIIKLAIGIIGLLAVIMIIVGGFQYTTSAGDTGKVTKAKNTILYGVIGLVIALLAYAIVFFVLKSVLGIE